jgi:hypothetical protein
VSVKVQSTSKPALRPMERSGIGLSAGLLVLCTFTDTMLHALPFIAAIVIVISEKLIVAPHNNNKAIQENGSPVVHRNARSVKTGIGLLSEKGQKEGAHSLHIPSLPIGAKSDPNSSEVATAVPPSRLRTDDDILTVGGVVKPEVVSAVKIDQSKQLKSIKSEDWDGKPNLLVNALRAGNGFEINHEQLMDFISGKELLGWPESLRNWIGDELMTALRQDMPETAFGDLKSIVDNPEAPEAMRDYSIQHITHLVTSGTIGQDGADYIWQALKKNDVQTSSTALMSLHRLSEQVPNLVSADKVRAAAERLKNTSDERTRITAESILNN